MLPGRSPSTAWQTGNCVGRGLATSIRYNTLDGLIYGTFILAAKVMWHLIDFRQSFYMAAALNEQIRKRKLEEIQKEGTNNG